jgi:hypothetical protein
MRSAEALGQLLCRQIYEISAIAGSVSRREILLDEGVKSRILEDPFVSIDITADDTFIAELSPTDLCLSMLRDYHFGYLRAQQQWTSALSLSADHKNIAWTVISIYYCSFFSALEILRIQRRVPLSLDGASAKMLFHRATGLSKGKFIAKDQRNFIGLVSNDFSKITFKANGIRPHQFVWNQLSNTTFSDLPSKVVAWEEFSKFKNICRGKGGWEIPSDIRNRWNYRDSLYFTTTGMASIQPFFSLLGNSDSASAWIRGNGRSRCENDAISSIAAMCHLLYGAMKNSYDFGFDRLELE